MHTPNLDAWKTRVSEVYERHVKCECDEIGRSNSAKATQFRREHGTLCKKQTARGWRRQWQCDLCLRMIPGDGVNAGPATANLPLYIESGDAVRKAAAEKRYAPYKLEREELDPARRAAWFADHDLYLKTVAWKKLRSATLLRDGSKCARCGAQAEQVHHLTYERWQHEELSDLESLCKPCHDKEHAR